MDSFDFEPDLPQERLATVGDSRTDKRVVCRYWLEGRCLKEQECRFLHVLDHDKMPECKFGSKCSNPACIFKHIRDEEKEECPNYRLGFCAFGVSCRFRHVRRAATDLPPVAECWTTEYLASAYNKRKFEENVSNWRVKECPDFARQGWCPYFDVCNFAHGADELRSWRPGGRERMMGGGGFQNSAGPGAGFDHRSGGAGGSFNRDAAGSGRGGFQGRALPYQQQQQQQQYQQQQRPGAGGQLQLQQGESPHFDANGAPTLAGLLAAYATGAAAELELPDAPEVDPNSAPTSAYFIVRCADPEGLALSLRVGEWAAPTRAGEAVSAALWGGAASVFLIFSIVGSQHFQGVARVRGAPRTAAPTEAALAEAPAAGGASAVMLIPVEWLRTCALPFAMTAGLRNPAAPGSPPVARSGGNDWVSVPAPVGRALLLLLYRAPAITVDTGAVPSDARFAVFDGFSPSGAAALASEDVGPEVAAAAAAAPPPLESHVGHGGNNGARGNFGGRGGGAGGGFAPPPPPPPREILQLFDADVAASMGAPATPFIASLLAGEQPPGTPPPPVLAADALVRGQPGYLFVCNNVTFPTCLAKGVFAASEEPRSVASVAAGVRAGTPMLLLNVHSFMLHGLFIARGPAVRDLVPHLVPKMGVERKAFPLHVQVLAAATPQPLHTASYERILSPRPQPGPIPPAAMHAIATAMFATMPAADALRVAGLLHQMAAVGMPTRGLHSVLQQIAITPNDPAAYAATVAGPRGPAAPLPLPGGTLHAFEYKVAAAPTATAVATNTWGAR